MGLFQSYGKDGNLDLLVRSPEDTNALRSFGSSGIFHLLWKREVFLTPVGKSGAWSMREQGFIAAFHLCNVFLL